MLWNSCAEHQLAKQVTFVALVVAFVSGCSPLRTNFSTLHSDDINTAGCDALIKLYSNSNEAFEALRFNPSVKSKVTLWESSYQLINNRCQIWQWADKYSYVCNKTYPDQETAYQAYEEAQAHINECLSENPQNWYEQQNVLEGRAEETRYFMNNEERGFLKKIKVKGLLKDSWSVFLLIDSPAQD